MTLNKYDLTNIECKIYYESNDEFESVRNLCLAEGNWLGKNYTKENLKLEDRTGYGVLYQKSTGKPIIMGGVYSPSIFPNNVARQLDRFYAFPEFRTNRTNYMDGWKVIFKLIDALEAINNYDTYIITMQNRPGRTKKNYWEYWKSGILNTSKLWNEHDGYIQTCPWDVKNCWQNFVWTEKKPGAFLEWNPQIISDDEWLKLDQGK